MEQFKSYIENKQWDEIRRLAPELPAPDVADVLLQLDKAERVLIFTSLPRRLASEVFAFLAPREKDELLAGLTVEETRRLLTDLRPDDRTNALEDLPGQVTQRLLNLLSPEDLREVRLLLGFPDDSAGRLMTPDYVAVRRQWTVGQALDHIRMRGKDSETISIIYVTDESWHLQDALELQRFILASPTDTVEMIMDHTYVSLSPLDDREEAVHKMRRYDLWALPVVDEDGVLLGVVTVDDVMDVAEEEATEDFQKSAAIAPLGVPYREAGVFSLFRKRVGWLLILVLVNLVSSGVIAAFEETLSAFIALAYFIPLLIDSGGNTGAQSASLMIRGLATGEVEMKNWLRTLLKELGVGLALGLTMGAATWVLGVWRGGIEVAMVVGLTMVALVLLANILGMLLPFILTRLKLDPAVASSPLITTLVDALGLFLYFSIAVSVLRP